MSRVLCVAVLLSLTSLSFAQRRLIVDKRGGVGIFTTIQAAVNAARNGDRIEVRPGAYQEHVKIDAKAISLYGSGTRPQDVLLFERTLSATPAVLTITRHPAQGRTRLAHFALGRDIFIPPGGPIGISIEGGSGEIVMDRVHAIRRTRVLDHKGRVHLQACLAKGAFRDRLWTNNDGAPALEVRRSGVVIANAGVYIGDSGTAAFGVIGKGGAAVVVEKARLELVHPTLLGGHGSILLFGRVGSQGGPGLDLIDASARVIGVANDSIRGGNAPNGATNRPSGGPGIRLTRSQLSLGPVTVTGGGGPVNGPRLRVDASSKVTTPQPALATLNVVAPFRIGQRARFDLQGPSGHAAVLLLSLGVGDVALPFGPLYIDLTTFLFPTAAVFDNKGRASFSIPLENSPNMIGIVITQQALTIDRSARLSLAAAAASVVLR